MQQGKAEGREITHALTPTSATNSGSILGLPPITTTRFGTATTKNPTPRAVSGCSRRWSAWTVTFGPFARAWMITELQYQSLMKIFQENGGNVSDDALRAGVSRETATDYPEGPPQPEERRRMRDPRTYRTRPDPVVELWLLALSWPKPTPELDAKALFEHLLGKHPEWIARAGRSLRTFQRRVHEWRVKHGPEKENFFAQLREPGQSMQFD